LDLASICTLPGPTIETPFVTPGGAFIWWMPQAGATYSVARSDVGLLTPEPIAYRRPFVDSSPLFYTRTYTYTVTSRLATGCGTSAITVVPPKPFTPIARTLYDNSIPWPLYDRPGIPVELAFQVPKDYQQQITSPVYENIFLRIFSTGFLLIGPGLRDGEQRIDCGGPQGGGYNSVQACENWLEYNPIVPPYVGAGEWTWIIAPFWETNNGFMSDVGSGARVTVKIVR
jgi:hypothetical protein